MSNDGGPAFPHEDGRYGSDVEAGSHGMTLRDYFAAKAMAGMGLKWDGAYSQHDRQQGRPEADALWAAIAAYRYADAMLEKRKEA